MTPDWHTNWDLFVDKLTEHLAGGADNDALADHFGGETVCWSGVLQDKHLDRTAQTVHVSMNERHIEFSDGKAATIGSLSVPVADDRVDQWNSIPDGSTVKFSATFVSSMWITQPVEVKRLPSGTIIIFIRLTEARLA